MNNKSSMLRGGEANNSAARITTTRSRHSNLVNPNILMSKVTSMMKVFASVFNRVSKELTSPKDSCHRISGDLLGGIRRSNKSPILAAIVSLPMVLVSAWGDS
jgi:hypothetical protein